MTKSLAKPETFYFKHLIDLRKELGIHPLIDNRENPCCKERDIPVLFIMTSNAPDSMYSELVSSYQQTFNSFVGPCEVLVSGETLQINDYSKLDWDWSIFDPEQKKKRRETVFPQERRKAFEMVKSLAER